MSTLMRSRCRSTALQAVFCAAWTLSSRALLRGQLFAMPTGGADGEVQDYEAAFQKRFQQVKKQEAEAPKQRARKVKKEPSAPAWWAFWENRAGAEGQGKNFLSPSEWNYLVVLVGVLMVLTSVIFAWKMSPWGRGF
ncbi:unnamed protein product [Cladocopium goreaui]|uniref:Stress-associated endoplasmic reticulum protein n=1 Tax=Cladocopium goreaui TaxID=2562237 RepID=A0A9P1FIN8_9DINO|nr:unnamed protein product [Cladocopium goreaui]